MNPFRKKPIHKLNTRQEIQICLELLGESLEASNALRKRINLSNLIEKEEKQNEVSRNF